jgi:hypothetical protein
VRCGPLCLADMCVQLKGRVLPTEAEDGLFSTTQLVTLQEAMSFDAGRAAHKAVFLSGSKSVF